MHYKIIFLLCLTIISYSHIYSSTPKVTYDFDGNPLKYHIYLSLQTGIGSDDFLKITWPQVLHTGTDKTKIKVKLISFSNNLEIIETTFQAIADTNPIYFVKLGYSLTASKWYQIQIFPNSNPSVYKGLIQLSAQSDTSAQAIVYDQNLAFCFIGIQPPLSGPQTLTVLASSTSSENTRTASIYTLLIDITPTIPSTSGGNFTVYIYYDSSVVSHNSGTTDLDFTFMGLCQSVQNSFGNTIVINFCEISADLSTITFSMNSVTNAPIRISTQISNPLYVSTRGIKAYWINFISGVTMERGRHNNALSVLPITISAPATGRVYLFWGIDKNNPDPDFSDDVLSIYRGSGTSLGPFNSFNIGFMLAQTSPINGQYRVIMKLGATGLLQGTIAHNLPSFEGKQVYCHYNTVNKQIQCENVGAFINTNYRYFISGKAHFDQLTSSTISTFGDVEIRPVWLSSTTGLALPVQLYTDLVTAQIVKVRQSKQYLDTSGYHNTGNFKIGNAQVISFEDNGALTSTGDAMKQFIAGTNSSVGIIPDLGVSQQLLFFMNIDTIHSGTGSDQRYTTKLLYNNKVIGFQTGADTRGLDFVGYQNGTGNWSISYAPCHLANQIVCEKYNFDPPTKNIQVRVNQTSQYNNYGMYKFYCGLAYTGSPNCTGDCSTQCTMFKPYSASGADFSSSVMAMRKVTFPTGYYSSIYADENLLDFLFVFIHGTTVSKTILVNGYTIVGKKMQNIKASYVNYYDHTSNYFNKGIRIPMMIRIGGGVLPTESRDASVIGVFFDDYVDASTFWNDYNNNYDIGCSTGSCKYYSNRGIQITRNDIWHANRAVYFYNIPSIQNQFNILVPVTPSTTATARGPPKILTIAFFSTNHTIADVSGLLKTLSVYRLFGPGVTQDIGPSQPINAINSLARTSGSALDTNFEANSWSNPGMTFSYTINTTNINSNPPNNTFTYGANQANSTFGSNGRYGTAVTITSFYYNIFASSTLAFENPPPNTATTCSIFGYIYNEIDSLGSNPDRNKKPIYTAFCPIDSAFNSYSADGNIKFLNPQYPNVFTNNFPLQQVIAYGFSNYQGFLKAYKRQVSAISGFTRVCTTTKLNPYNPFSNSTGAGKQRATFTVSTPQILMSNTGIDGYSIFKVVVTLPGSTGGSLTMQNSAVGCLINDALLSCTVISADTSSTTLYINYVGTGTGTYTVTSFELGLYAKATGTFGAVGDYTLAIYLPQQTSSNPVIFGTTFSPQTSYCSCTSSFTIGITADGKDMIFDTLTTNTLMKTAKSPIEFNFASKDYRPYFYTTSTYQFNFGFLSGVIQPDYNKNNFKCLIFDITSGTQKLSTFWNKLDFSTLTSVKLSSKSQISNPKGYLFKMKCLGSGVSDGTPATSMSLSWKDGADTLQTATPMAVPGTYISAAGGSITLIFNAQRFKNEGFKSFYSFAVTSSIDLDEHTRLYFDFHFKVLSQLDSEGKIQCYTRTNSAIVDTQAIFSYCQFSYQRQLVIWNNINITAGTTFYIDIFNVQQPKSSDIDVTKQFITLTIDNDDNYTNGQYGKTLLADTLSTSSNGVSNIKILQTSLNTTFIRSPQTITIKFEAPSPIFSTPNRLYLVLPSSYSEWITRGYDKSIDCIVLANGVGSNLATSCSFISKRILKISVNNDGNTIYTLTVNNMLSPSQLPNGKLNQFRFKMFLCNVAETTITYYTFTDYSKQLTLQPDNNLIDLTWIQFQISQGDSLLTLTQPLDNSKNIYIGYYSNVLQLRQSLYPNNFQTSMELIISNYNTDKFLTLLPSKVQLGKSVAYFRMAANSTIPAGLYTLQFIKTGDTNNLYTAIPPLTLVVSNSKCFLNTDQLSYILPVGGHTLPIKISAIKCIPIQDITINVSFNRTGVRVNNDLSSLKLTKSSLDGKMYIVIEHIDTALVSGQIVTVIFSISGSNAANYAPIPNIVLNIADPSTFQILPSATALSAPVLATNTAKFTLQCSMGSTIYWGLGIYPSILNTQALDMQARIISQGQGLKTNFTQVNDFYSKVYGINSVPSTQTLTKILYNLKSNTDYIFKYLCINQLGFISDSQSINFTSLNYGAFLMKVSITFRGAIAYGQYHDLSCSLAQNFKIPYNRVMTEVMSYCNSVSMIFYPLLSSKIANEPDSNGQYLYNFYILPDYTIANDNTNLNIRSSLALHSFTTTVITSTNNFSQLPEFVLMQTQDIQVFTTPIIKISDPIAGLNSVIFKASITNMNGFIIVGVLNGVFNASTMILPTTINIKRGLFEQDTALLAVRMQYASQNFNVSISVDNLSADTQYSLFYFASSDDPTFTAISGTVQTAKIKTLQVLDIDINWSSNNFVQIVLLVMLLCFGL